MIRAQNKKKKRFFSLAPQLNIFNRPLLHLSHFSVPKYCERRITWEKYRFPKYLTCEEKGRMFCWILHEYYTWCNGMSHVPCASILLPWGRQQIRTQFEYKRTEVTYNGLQALPFDWAENRKWLFGGILLCWLCKSSKTFTWIKKIKNCCEQRLTFQLCNLLPEKKENESPWKGERFTNHNASIIQLTL